MSGNKKYLTIGEVAKIKGVSVKSLRYYEKVGILRPAYINSETGYRYYLRSQLAVVDFIILFIEMGIPLSDFDKYRDKCGRVELNAILSDAETLAEKKLKEITENLSKMAIIRQGYEVYKEYNSSTKYTRYLPERRVFLLELGVSLLHTESVLGRITQAYFDAMEEGLSVSYSCGVLRNYDGRIYVYVGVVGDNTAKTVTIPAGEYDCLIVGSTEESTDYLHKTEGVLITEYLLTDLTSESEMPIEIRILRNND